MTPISSAAMQANLLAMRQAILDKNTALQSPGNGADLAAPLASGVSPFADLLAQGMHQVSSIQGESSAQMNAYETGEQTDIAAVMLARQKASVAFEATMQVRNKLLSAYSDIMNMPL